MYSAIFIILYEDKTIKPATFNEKHCRGLEKVLFHYGIIENPAYTEARVHSKYCNNFKKRLISIFFFNIYTHCPMF